MQTLSVNSATSAKWAQANVTANIRISNPLQHRKFCFIARLIARAFFDTDQGPQEFAYIPDDLFSLDYKPGRGVNPAAAQRTAPTKDGTFGPRARRPAKKPTSSLQQIISSMMQLLYWPHFVSDAKFSQPKIDFAFAFCRIVKEKYPASRSRAEISRSTREVMR